MILVIMTKKVVRKKRVNKTKRRSRTRSRRTRVKRGGMMAAVRRVINRNKLLQNVSELLSQYEYIVSTPPQASDGNIVNKGQRYGTFADIPVDPVKSSIEELKKELENDVKSFEKIKTLYDKIIKTVEDEKRKQQDKENSMKSKRSTASQFSQSPFSHVLPHSLQKPGGNQSINREDALKQLMGGPSGTPKTDRYPDYSTNRTTPINPRPKGDISQGHDLGENHYEGEGLARHLEFMSPDRSPHPPSHEPQSPDNNEEDELARSLGF